MAATAFGAPFSLWERTLSRCSSALAVYWRFARWLYSFLVIGVLLTALVQWIVDSFTQKGSLPDPLRWPPLRALERLPVLAIVLVVLGVVVIVGSVVIAFLASRNKTYYALLDASAVSYRVMRRVGPGTASGFAYNPDRTSSSPSASAVASPDLLEGFEDALYTERADALATYEDFLDQHEKRILLIIGPGGSGKSTFLMRRMGELSGVLRARTPLRPHPCVLINCDADALVDMEKLLERIKERLGKQLKDIVSDDVRGRHDRALVVFIDAINENRTARDADINKLLTDFAQGYLDVLRGFEVYLCLTVRKAYWDEQRRQFADDPTSAKLGWLNHVYLPERSTGSVNPGRSGRSTETASISLADFAESEFDTACQNYLSAFGIGGQIEDERTRATCRNPLMLEFFCKTFKGQGLGESTARNLARDIDLFNEYAKTGLSRIAGKVGIKSAEPIINGETLAQRAIRGLLLELALEMERRGRAFLTDDEVFDVARVHASESLEYPRQGIRTVGGLYQEGTVLHALLSEGVVLERGRTVLSGRDEVSGVRFRYERYLEYSIGRGLVRTWRNGHLSQAEIVAEFSQLMRRHVDLRLQGFYNLREGLGMAILVAEQEPALPAGIHIELLRVLARDSDFDWNQLVCRMALELKPFNRPASDGPRSPQEQRELDDLLSVIDELAKKNDFVLRWDIERVLIHVVNAGEGQAVVQYLRRWLDPTATFAQRLFASESVGYMFRQLPEQRQELTEILKQLVETGSEPDFWILRSLMFSIGAMTDTLEADTVHEGKLDQLKAELEILPDELLALGQHWWDRSVVLAAQVDRAAMRGDLGRWQTWQWAGESPWTLVNVALATEQACALRGGSGEIIGLLRRLWLARSAYNPHLSWAIWHVLGLALDSAGTAEPERADAVELRGEIEAEAKQQLAAADHRAEWVLPARPRAGQPLPAVTAGTVALVYQPEYSHTDLHNHPESKERVQSVLDFLEAATSADGRFLRDLMTYVSPGQLGEGPDEENEQLLELVHRPTWINRVKALSQQLAEEAKPDIVLESDLEVRAGSYEGAVLAVRGAVLAMDLVLADPGLPLAVALVRPPGHLAGNKICIFNNVAIAARHGQQVLKAKTGQVPRVLIVDIDAHHGKSTHDIFYADGSVFYFSIHQEGAHPGTGRFEERGRGPGDLNTANVPIPALSGDRVYAEVFRLVLQPILDGFQPELILVSLGMDAYCQDNFSQLNMTERVHGELASMLIRYRQQHPIPGVVASLEGGYDLYGMPRCAGEFIGAFTGWAPAPAPVPSLRPGTPMSWFDHYLLDQDRGLAPDVPGEHREWHANFTNLATTLRTQWVSSGRPANLWSGPVTS